MSGNQKKKRGGAGSVLTTVLLIAAICVFAYSAIRLYGYYRAYKAGTDEYSGLSQEFADLEGGDAAEGQSENAVGADDGLISETENVTEGASGATGAGLGSGSGTGAASGVAAGAELRSVTSLENPGTLMKMLANAKKEKVIEDDEEKLLPTLKNPINFEELQKLNPEVIGWIRIGALDLSYPVAQAEDNDFYLHRTFLKEDNFAGCIFLNCDNSNEFTDQNTIIYGHNMKNGAMFGTLKKFSEQETYDKNPYFWIFTPKFIYQYQIFSTSIVARSGDPYRVSFPDDEFEAFLEHSAETSEIETDVKVTKDDRVVTLSTCTGDDTTRRIVQGVLCQVYVAK